MASQTSNLGVVTRSLNNLTNALNLRRKVPGGNGTIGQDIIDTAALVIEDRSVSRQVDPDGNPWAPLKARTIKRKARLGLDPRINIATHEMLDINQIQGRDTVTADTAVMQAGLTQDAINKTKWAEDGGPHRKPRPFYDLGPDGEKAVDQVIRHALDQAVNEANKF